MNVVNKIISSCKYGLKCSWLDNRLHLVILLLLIIFQYRIHNLDKFLQDSRSVFSRKAHKGSSLAAIMQDTVLAVYFENKPDYGKRYDSQIKSRMNYYVVLFMYTISWKRSKENIYANPTDV